MNDSTLLHREARARQNRENATKLASLGITPAEASLFNVIHYGLTVSADDLCYRAAHGDYMELTFGNKERPLQHE